MVRMIHGVTGNEMWVHETRVDEYLAAGHKLAASPETPEEKTEEKPRRTRAKK